MKTILTIILTTLALYTNAKIVYVDNHDEVIVPNSEKSIYIDINNDNIIDVSFYIGVSSGGCYFSSNGGNTQVNSPYLYQVMVYNSSTNNTSSICKNTKNGDTIDYRDLYTGGATISIGRFPYVCSGNSTGRYSLGIRLTKVNPISNKNGFIYGYIDYSLTTSGDLVVHGWYYNDAFNEPIIANNTATYPYNGCVYQDTIKTYVNVNVYDTVKVHKTVYDTVKVTKIEIVKKTVYDTVKVEKIVYKPICDTTIILTHHDTIHKIIYDTIKKHVTINDTIHKTIYNTVKVNVYDTITVPISVHDTLVVELGNKGKQRIRLWPNPAQQTITIDLSDPADAEIEIIDLSGKVITNTKTPGQLFQIDASQWTVGTYTVIITQLGKTTTKHLQIIR